MSPLAIVVSIAVAMIGLVGVGLTAWAGLRSNSLRLQAEERAKLLDEDRQREAAEAVARKDEADRLRIERDRILAYHEGLHAQHAVETTRKDAEIDRLERARAEEHEEVLRLRGVVTEETEARMRENAEVRRLRALLESKENPT